MQVDRFLWILDRKNTNIEVHKYICLENIFKPLPSKFIQAFIVRPSWNFCFNSLSTDIFCLRLIYIKAQGANESIWYFQNYPDGHVPLQAMGAGEREPERGIFCEHKTNIWVRRRQKQQQQQQTNPTFCAHLLQSVCNFWWERGAFS